MRKLLYSIPTLLGVTLITFLIFNVVGGDPAYQLAGKNATVEQIQTLRLELGLNKPLIQQYFIFVKQIINFDWGHSWQTQESINQMLLKGISPSLSLMIPSFILSLLICIFSALYTTHFRGTWVDRFITVFCLALMSISSLLYIIVFQYYFAYKLGLFPINGWDPSWLSRWQYLLLPWLINVCVFLGPNILIYRTAIINEALQDYVITAKAKGITYPMLYLKHILKNAMIPIGTLILIQIPFLLTGSLLLEAFFSIPGTGGLLIQAIHNADFPVIKAFTVMGSIAYMFFNLLADLSYKLFDPRVELE